MIYRESEYIELKRELTKEIKKEIIAFANTNGGTIYLGIDDDGKVVGLNDATKDLEKLSNMIHDGIKADLTLYTKSYIENIEGKDIIIIKIAEAPNKPYYITEKGLKTSGVYLRHGIISSPASEENIKKLLKESDKSMFEEEISYLQNLSLDYIFKTFKIENIELDKIKQKTLNIRNLDGYYTNLGLLLSEQNPYTIKFAIYNGNDKTEFSDRREFKGNILEQLTEIFKFLDLFNKTSGKIVGFQRVDTRDYPEYALREALLNAIIHRDYTYKGSILIHMFNDRVEIVSIGGLVKGITLNDIYLGVSESRNPKLANIFFRLNYVESFGTGIGRIINSYKDYDVKPKFKESDNAFLVSLPNINYQKEKSNFKVEQFTQEEQIIQYLKRYNKITRIVVEEILGISKTRAFNILNNMIKNKLLIKEGNGKSIIYRIKD